MPATALDTRGTNVRLARAPLGAPYEGARLRRESKHRIVRSAGNRTRARRSFCRRFFVARGGAASAVSRFLDVLGRNWDALEDLLRNLEWLDSFRIVVTHESLPELPSGELDIYLAILGNSVQFWRDRESAEHELAVVFPRNQRETVLQTFDTASRASKDCFEQKARGRHEVKILQPITRVDGDRVWDALSDFLWGGINSLVGPTNRDRLAQLERHGKVPTRKSSTHEHQQFPFRTRSQN